MLLTILCCFHASLNDCCQCDRFPSCFWTHWGQSHNYGFKKISALPYLLSMLISTYAFVPLMNFPISILYLNTSVTWWLDYLFNIWPFTTMRMCPKYIKIYQSMWKIIQNEHFQNGRSCLNSWLSGEILPNLVTLHVCAIHQWQPSMLSMYACSSIEYDRWYIEIESFCNVPMVMSVIAKCYNFGRY